MNRKRRLLFVLLGLLALSLGYAFWSTPRQTQAPPRATAPRPAEKKVAVARGKAAAKEKPAADHLLIELLDREEQPFPGADRDIFSFYRKPPPVVAPVAVTAAQAPPPPPPPPPTPEQILRQQLASYKVIGYLEKGGARSVFLSTGNEVYVARTGQRFGPRNEFLVAAISAGEMRVQQAQGTASVSMSLAAVATRETATMAPEKGGGGRSAPVVPPRFMPPEPVDEAGEPESVPEPEPGTDQEAVEEDQQTEPEEE